MKRTFSPAPSQQAFDWIDQWAIHLSIQQLPLQQAAGYILAHDMIADNNIPAKAVCARDGFALSAADTLGAGDYNPLPLQLTQSPIKHYSPIALSGCHLVIHCPTGLTLYSR